MLPYKNENFGSALQLLEEEMAREYGDEQPFIDPGSQAYEAANNKRHQDLCQVKHFFDIVNIIYVGNFSAKG